MTVPRSSPRSSSSPFSSSCSSSATSRSGLAAGVEPAGPWGPVELMAVIAGPVFLLCLLLMVGVFIFQYHQRAYSHRQRLEVEDTSCDHLYLAKDRTIQDLIYDMSTSGSGSGLDQGRLFSTASSGVSCSVSV